MDTILIVALVFALLTLVLACLPNVPGVAMALERSRHLLAEAFTGATTAAGHYRHVWDGTSAGIESPTCNASSFCASTEPVANPPRPPRAASATGSAPRARAIRPVASTATSRAATWSASNWPLRDASGGATSPCAASCARPPCRRRWPRRRRARPPASATRARARCSACPHAARRSAPSRACTACSGASARAAGACALLR